MTTRLLLLLLLTGGVVWLRIALLRWRNQDRARGPAELPRVPAALRGGGPAWVVFTTPLCVSCAGVEQLLRERRPHERVVLVDATQDPDLAARWEVRRSPTTLLVEPDGTVAARLVGLEAVRDLLEKPIRSSGSRAPRTSR